MDMASITDEDQREDLVGPDLLEGRIREVMRNLGGHGRLTQIAGGVGRNVVSVNGALAQMERKGLLKQSGPWWRITPKGERARPVEGNSDRNPIPARARAGASVKKSIDYGIVLEDLRRRRDELEAAIAAIEQLEA